MASRTFDRETLLDLTVNMIPLGIMLFFIGVFVLYNPFGTDPVATALQLTIVGVTFLALLVLTYYSGKAISEAEEELEAEAGEHAEPDMADEEVDADVDDEGFDEVTSDEPAEGAAAVGVDGEHDENA
ncbi:DUF6684 family protein [Halorarius halobius]|uniref:DUF6684 family protein n=1 Tax=Halorarius halobius TaxID=2962671 RepID=UPI0020CBA11E|nr:DUF6684 family protein [Halorarius halobius]